MKLIFHPFNKFYKPLILFTGAGAYPRMHRARRIVHPEQVATLSQAQSGGKLLLNKPLYYMLFHSFCRHILQVLCVGTQYES